MLKLATLINNPGEPEVDSRYNDPRLLRDLGYNALVVYETTALSGVESADVIDSGELRRWVQHHIDHAARKIEEAQDAGLDVFLFYDALVLTEQAANRNPTALTCRNRPLTLCPASEQAWDASVRALEATLRRWPGIAGVVLRFGDTDAPRLPHLVGNDIYSPHCPRCSQFGRADRITAALERFHQLVVERMNKRLIVRAWNVRPNGLHDSTELARRVLDRLPGDPTDDRLILSFKFTQTDFWRYQRWNPCSLIAGPRPIIYELQCQREFEGKGGFPNYQARLWRDGAPEIETDQGRGGLATLDKQVNLAGLWAWVRGGGWGGPFIKNETWIDANVFAVPRLAEQPDTDPQAIAEKWIESEFGIKKKPIRQRLCEILIHSADAVRDGFYLGPFARQKADPWHPNADWIQDDLVDAQALWRIIQRLPNKDLDAVVDEKTRAAERFSRDRHDLQKLVAEHNLRRLEPLIGTLMYAESLFEALRDLCAGLVAYRRFKKSPQDTALADTARRSLYHAQSHWNHHVQRVGAMRGAATPFREAGFWDLTQHILGELG
jgi:hypothetical protein